ncbi:MAG: hypothetical protein NC217_02175 [Muribaculaceae bacterium]|nr:hypothetical protein [Muribaculaceae bacterium]
MKKISIIKLASMAALLLCVGAFSSCGDNTNKDKSAVNKTAKTTKGAKASDSTDVNLISLEDYSYKNVDEALIYLEANSEQGFAQISSTAAVLNKMMAGETLTEAETAKLNDPSAIDEKFLEALFYLIQSSMEGKTTQEQEAAIAKFADEHAQGMQDFGTIFEVAAMSQQAAQQGLAQ